jgi:hypothetical protein
MAGDCVRAHARHVTSENRRKLASRTALTDTPHVGVQQRFRRASPQSDRRDAVVRYDRGVSLSPAVLDTTHFHGPLGLVIAPNGDFLITQGDAVNPDPTQPSELVEYDPMGRFRVQMPIDPSSGAAFGLAIEATDSGFIFAAVDDAINVLDVWRVP